MRVSELIRIVWINMRRNKSKVLLTALGIIIGTITIVLVIDIGQGAEKKAAEQYSYLSADTIYVNPNYEIIKTDSDYSKIEKLTPEIIEKTMKESTTLSGLYLRGDTSKSCIINGQKKTLSITGVTEDYATVSNIYTNTGANLTYEDMEREARVCVIGYDLAKQYYKSPSDAIENVITIENHQYKIIGVLKKTGDGLQGLNADTTVFLPYSTLVKDKQFDKYTIPLAVGKAKTLNLVKRSIAEIENSLRYYLENKEAYAVSDAGSRIEAATESARTMKWLLLSVAIIVFIVSGIGIMNVLFVTVKKRTREIGVLKALGSTNGDILKQFLIESSGIGAFGGMVGIAISFVAVYFLSFTDIPVASSMSGKAVAFAFAVTTSTLSGLYPAYIASQLKPVDALNQE